MHPWLCNTALLRSIFPLRKLHICAIPSHVTLPRVQKYNYIIVSQVMNLQHYLCLISFRDHRVDFSQRVFEGREGPPNSQCGVTVDFMTSIANSLTLRFIPQTFDEIGAARNRSASSMCISLLLRAGWW